MTRKRGENKLGTPYLELGKQSEPYDLFIFAINAEQTKDKYITRLKKFFEIIGIDQEKRLSMQERSKVFVSNASSENGWLLNVIINFLQYQKDRVSHNEITGSTLRNYVKVLKLFCEMNDLFVPWKKLTRGLPKAKNYADDRVPTIEEIRKIASYPDWRIKAIVFTMATSGIRLGAWDHLKWTHIVPLKRAGQLIGAKIIVYAGDLEQYFSFISAVAYIELKKWMEFRMESGEEISGESWVMRDLWNTRQSCRRRGVVGLPSKPVRLKSSGIKRLMEDAIWSQGIRKRLEPGKRRHEFQVDHGYRKWFKTQCELSGMRSINIEILMGHSIGISDSYYRITESELLDDYLKAIPFLSISETSILGKQVKELSQNTKEIVQRGLQEKNMELQQFREHYQMNIDAIAALSEQVTKLTREIELLKTNRSITVA